MLAALALAVALQALPPAPPPGQFSGRLDLRPLMVDCPGVAKGKPGAPAHRCPLLRNGHAYYALGLPLRFTTAAGVTLTVFAGERTDLASIPEALWGVLPPDGQWIRAATIHDACYRTKGAFNAFGHVGSTRTTPLVRAECDETLRQAMVADQVSGWKRVVIYEAVRVGGGRGWGS